MRGADRQTAAMFSYASPESLVPRNHPLRAIRILVNAALEQLSDSFDKLYSPIGRDSINRSLRRGCHHHGALAGPARPAFSGAGFAGAG